MTLAIRYGSSNLLYTVRPSWIDDALQLCIESVYPYLQQYTERSITAIEFLHAILHDNFYE